MMTRFSTIAAALFCLWTASPCSAAGDAQRSQKLTAILKSPDASFFDKARACQQLGEIGTAEAVPALAALLADEHLSAYARSGLEGIPDPAAAEALRNALTLNLPHRNQRCGVIDSLGVLRDTKAVPALCKLASDPTSGVVKDSLLALGRIATPESIEFLRKALTEGPDASRPDTAAASLLAAEQQITAGRFDNAVSIYDAVRTAKVPASLRIAAIRGAILARKSNTAPFLIAQLESDPVARLAALTTIREIPSDAVANAINAELPKATPELQCQIMVAMIDCHNDSSLKLLRAKAEDQDPALRETALTVLGQIGGPADAQVLLGALSASRSANETTIATAGLRRLSAPGTDPLIIQALSSAKDADARIKLIRLLGAREAAGANGELLRHASGGDPATAIAALGVLSTLATTNELPALIALTKSASDKSVKSAAETALANSCERIGDPAADAVLAELQQPGDIHKTSWIRVLAAIGYAKALPAINLLLTSTNETLAADALEQLGKWPDPTPVPDLLALLESSATPGLRTRARTSALQLAANATDEHQRPDPIVIAWLARAARAAETADLRQIISILGRLKQPESFRALQPHLDTPALRLDAARAIIQIAPALLKSDVAPSLKQELQKITADLDPDLSAQAQKIAAQIP